jgi:hypothetical protein
MRHHQWQPGQIFVFGSNLLGAHNGGAAKDAVTFCHAVHGVALGRTGDAFALHTMEQPGSKGEIFLVAMGARALRLYAEANPALTFFLTRVGCGIAGLKDEDVAPYFAYMPENVILPPEWEEILENK